MNRGHGLLCASFYDKPLLDFLSRVTDMPISKPADMKPVPFFGGHVFGEYMIFTKTIPDDQGGRPGMVFTHAICIPLLFLNDLHDLELITRLFVTSIPRGQCSVLEKLYIYEQAVLKPVAPETATALMPILRYLLSRKEDEYLVIPEDSGTLALFSGLWNAMVPSLRHLLTFRLSFTSTDTHADHLLYYTPVSLTNRWPLVSQYRSYDLQEQAPLAALLLLQDPSAAPFAGFLNDLDYTSADFKGYRLCETAYDYYRQLATLSPQKLLQLARLVLHISPAINKGTSIKKAVAASLQNLLDSPQNDSFLLLSLANIDPVKIRNFDIDFSEKVLNTLTAWWKLGKRDLLLEILERRLEASDISWWVIAVDNGFQKKLKKINEADVDIIWALWQQMDKTIRYLWAVIHTQKGAEDLFAKGLPGSLSKKTFNELLPFVKQQHWYQLHAAMIIQQLAPKEALKQQVLLSETDKPSLRIIAAKFEPIEFVETAITSQTEALIEIAMELPVTTDALNDHLIPENTFWQAFALSKISEAIRQKKQIADFKSMIYCFFDVLVDGKSISEDLLATLAATSMADLSEYPKRKQLWAHLPKDLRKKFLKATGSAMLEHLTTIADLESDLKDAMITLNIAGDYMHNHAKQWSDILRIFELLPSLPERYLQDHINYAHHMDTVVNATRLGALVYRNNWRQCATAIYDKAKYNDSFKPALSQCILLLDTWKKLKATYIFTNMTSRNWSITESEWLNNLEDLCCEMYDEENEVRMIWKKAGGDVSELKSKESARVIWHQALQDLKKSKVKELTFKKLLQEMLTQVPAKREHLQILLNALRDIPQLK